jgi:hypothetical protein
MTRSKTPGVRDERNPIAHPLPDWHRFEHSARQAWRTWLAGAFIAPLNPARIEFTNQIESQPLHANLRGFFDAPTITQLE